MPFVFVVDKIPLVVNNDRLDGGRAYVYAQIVNFIHIHFPRIFGVLLSLLKPTDVKKNIYNNSIAYLHQKYKCFLEVRYSRHKLRYFAVEILAEVWYNGRRIINRKRGGFCEKEIIIGNTCFGYDGGLFDRVQREQ